MDDPTDTQEWKDLLARHAASVAAIQEHMKTPGWTNANRTGDLLDEYDAANKEIREYLRKATGR